MIELDEDIKEEEVECALSHLSDVGWDGTTNDIFKVFCETTQMPSHNVVPLSVEF